MILILFFFDFLHKCFFQEINLLTNHFWFLLNDLKSWIYIFKIGECLCLNDKCGKCKCVYYMRKLKPVIGAGFTSEYQCMFN